MALKQEIKKTAPLYDLKIDMDDDTALDAISLVTNPAVKFDYVKFNDSYSQPVTKRFNFKIQDAEQRMLLGVAMVPNIPILRRDPTNPDVEIDLENPDTYEEYYVQMSEETIRNAVKKYFKSGLNSSFNIEHDKPINGVYIVESWIVDDPKTDKSVKFGFTDIPKGTWMIQAFVEDENIWNEYIKKGTLQGFSVQGNFALGDILGEIQMSAVKNIEYNYDTLGFIADMIMGSNVKFK